MTSNQHSQEVEFKKVSVDSETSINEEIEASSGKNKERFLAGLDIDEDEILSNAIENETPTIVTQYSTRHHLKIPGKEKSTRIGT